MEPNRERELEQGYRSDPRHSQGAVALHLAGFQRSFGVRSPRSAGCESYEDQKTAEFIRGNVLPVKAHI